MVGKKYDAGKLRYDLLPAEPVEEIVEILTFGAQKYGDNNWQELENAEMRFYAALKRHLKDWKKAIEKGQWEKRFDEESGLSHLSHAMCNLVFLSWIEKNKYTLDGQEI